MAQRVELGSAPARLARYLFLARVPIFVAVILFALPIAARSVSVLGNLFVMRAEALGGAIILALVAAWLCAFSLGMIVVHGHDRFGHAPPRTIHRWAKATAEPKKTFWSMLPAALLVVPLAVVGVQLSRSDGSGRDSLPIYLMCIALAIVAGCLILLVFTTLYRGLKRVRMVKMPESGTAGRLATGYRDERGRLAAGHIVAAVLALTLFGLYLVGYFGLAPGNPFDWNMPALLYVLTALSFAVSVLSGLTFLFDRYRIPLVSSVILWAALNVWIGGPSHFFTVFPPPPEGQRSIWSDPTPASVAGVIGADDECPDMDRVPLESDVLIVTSAAGGGIQSAAWTSIVMTELQSQLEDREPNLGDDFARSLRLMSGTSGGAVGTMHFAGSYDPVSGVPRDVMHDGENRGPIAARSGATRSSLDATVWGFVFPDLTRLLIPGAASRVDRAWAVERSWHTALLSTQERAGLCRSGQCPPAPTMSDWMNDARCGRRPAIVFNSVDAGRVTRVTFNTVALGESDDRKPFTEFLTSESPQSRPPDIGVITAARIAATFPYITPMASARWRGESFDDPYLLPDAVLADGGYYDNSGMLAAFDFLDLVVEEIKSGKRSFRAIVLIELRPFANSEDEPLPNGIRSEFLGPIGTLYTARTTLQRARDKQRLSGLENALRFSQNKAMQSAGVADVSFKHVIIENTTDVSVLSWHLSDREVKRLTAAGTAAVQKNLEDVACVLLDSCP